jgi:tagatose 6-phosphate kinase
MILCIGTTPALQRVMVFGKLALDSVNRASKTLDGVAGKSVNVAKVLHALGERVLATGFLAVDRGVEIAKDFDSRGISHEFVTVPGQTRQCITVIDESSGAITELVEESHAASEAAYEQLLSIVRKRAEGCRALVMSGTITPGGPPDFYQCCTKTARETGALPVVDAQGPVLLAALKARPGLVKPNRTELSATVGRMLEDETAVITAMREMHDRGAQRVVVTAGKNPTLAFDGENVWRVESPLIKAVNPIGSGDAFTAGLAWRLVQGDNLGESCRWAAAAGAANALTLMAGELDKKDVERLAGKAKVERI